MRLPALDERLTLAMELFPACDYGADIGADHGRLSCALLAAGKCGRICAADISGESLEKARNLLAVHALAERVDFAVGDGLHALPRPAQSIAILGMGGRTLCHILEDGQDKLNGAALVVSAHTQLPLVRRCLSRLGYRIDREEVARAAGRFYVVLRTLPGEEALDDKALFLGPRLMESRAPAYQDYLSWRLNVTKCMRTPAASQQLGWLKEEEDRVRNRRGD